MSEEVERLLDAATGLLATATRPTEDSATAQVNAGALDRLRIAAAALREETTPTTHPDDATCAAPTSDDCLPVRAEERP